MAISKKYDYQTSQQKDTWTAEIIRRASKKNTVVSKKQDGFKTEAAANEWAEKELLTFTIKQSEQNKRRAAKRS
ncbi:MAG: pressure-regulated protein [Piscirickettsiaceae bacterium]|nr:MAG: pressure-regulated protein [Piscirickettsiaceae bacterium]